jgi:uncharacterized protein (DUF2252 family)
MFAAAGGCAVDPDPDADRAAWLHATLVEDNLALSAREPQLVAGKLARMSRSRFEFLRGTSRQYARDLLEPACPPWGDLGGLEDPEAWLVPLVGDPHPENLATQRRPDGSLRLEFDDFDAATHGPFVLDVWRLAVSFWIAAVDLAPSGLTEEDGAAAARRVAVGYLHGLDEPGTAPPVGVILEDLLEGARRDGDADADRATYTAVEDGRRSLVFGHFEEPVGGVYANTLVPVDDDTADIVAALLADAWTSLPGSTPVPAAELRPKSVGRRFGAGVSSYALLRWYAVVEGPTTAPDDDGLLEVKEAADPLAVGPHPLGPERRFASNGERIVSLQRELAADADPWLSWANAPPLSARVREVSAYHRGLRVARIADRLRAHVWTAQDVLVLAEEIGAVLGRAHADAHTASGRLAGDVVRAALGGREDAFVDGTERFARAYGPRIDDDFRLFRLLLEREGPLLGVRVSGRRDEETP